MYVVCSTDAWDAALRKGSYSVRPSVVRSRNRRCGLCVRSPAASLHSCECCTLHEECARRAAARFRTVARQRIREFACSFIPCGPQVDTGKGGYIQCTSLQQPIQLTNVSSQALDRLVLIEVRRPPLWY